VSSAAPCSLVLVDDADDLRLLIKTHLGFSDRF
jgi:hypothetical protein